MVVLKNTQGILEDKKLYGITPKINIDETYMSSALNSSLCRFFMDLSCRQLTGAQAIADVDVAVVDNILIPDHKLFPANSLDLAYSPFSKREMKSKIADEYTMSDRRNLDDIFFDALNLTSGEREAIYEAIIDLVQARLNKASNTSANSI